MTDNRKGIESVILAYSKFLEVEYGDKTIKLGLAYTTINGGDGTEWETMQVNANIATKSIEYENSERVFHVESFETYEALADYIEETSFEDCYSDWIEYAREASGLDLN